MDRILEFGNEIIATTIIPKYEKFLNGVSAKKSSQKYQQAGIDEKTAVFMEKLELVRKDFLKCGLAFKKCTVKYKSKSKDELIAL